MLRKSLDNVPLPGKVLHELARKFDGVPFNAADARDGDLCLIREEMVEAVAEFVEERRHVVMRERGGAVEVFTEAYTYAGIRSKVLGYSDVEGLALIPQLQKYVAGEISAEEALANAQSQGDSILAEAAQQ